MVSGDYLICLSAPKHRTYEKRAHLDSSNPTMNIRLDRQYQQPNAVYAQVGAQAGTLMAWELPWVATSATSTWKPP